ncbi:hypothetical protein BDN70DRAFT_870187 [Pholiota conissans]|uniref:Uncharacterized protein n=1 Tax=Pholiota conissans TaxID=109636 RepID=A0A9P5ZF58_9AGAR|nr:hypothetical protein BDN70DRAFT_870187 [Pholiota conissans]
MRTHQFVSLCTIGLVNLAIGRPVNHYSKTASLVGRDLLGLLGGVDSAPSLGPQEVAVTALLPTDSRGGAGHASPMSASPASFSSTPNGPTAIASTRFSSLTPGKPLITMAPSNTVRDPSMATFSSTPYNTGYASEAPATPPGELTEWKVIGIAVITITFIGTVILAVAFFDSWWGFVCDSFCGRRRKAGEKIGGETLVPDWEKASWEFRLANEDGHRYPTIPSLESMVREKEQVKALWVRGDPDLKTPEMAYGGISES